MNYDEMNFRTHDEKIKVPVTVEITLRDLISFEESITKLAENNTSWVIHGKDINSLSEILKSMTEQYKNRYMTRATRKAIKEVIGK